MNMYSNSSDYAHSFHSGSYHSNSDFQEDYEDNQSGMAFNHLALVASSQQNYAYDEPLDYLDDEQLESDEEEEEEEDPIDQNRVFNLQEVKVFMGEIICPICCHIIQNPINCGSCDQNFCTICISKWFFKRNSRNCPCCRQEYDFDNSFSEPQSLMNGKVPKILINLLSKLLLTCKHKDDGCNEIVTYEFREKHERQYCLYQIITCPNQGCNQKMCRNEIEEHTTICDYAKVICKYCSKDYLRMDIETHFNNCEYRLIKCEWCKEKIQARILQLHFENCEFRNITCKYCQKKFTLKQMTKHDQLDCAAQNIYQQQQNAQKYKELYVKTLSENNQKDQQIAQYEKTISELKILIDQLKQNRISNDLNPNHEEQVEDIYLEDFEGDEEIEEQKEEVIEEDIQIEVSEDQSLQKEKEENFYFFEESTHIDNSHQNVDLDKDQDQDKQSQDSKQSYDDLPSISEIKLRGMYISLLQRINDPTFKESINWTEEDRKMFLECLK